LALEAASGHVRWHFEAPAVFLCPPAFVPGPAPAPTAHLARAGAQSALSAWAVARARPSR
ncbi:hypothetical protein, partial [Streptomyces albogriseolus]|uniref:hypothetical protein n=1 Tax=Streptomyces albogriseolus TaxID=1887 RepID=UPI0034601FB6